MTMEENVINYDLIGKISSFRVLRETNLGYILEDIDGNEYFLHHNECDGKHLHFNDDVDAFLYVDKHKILLIGSAIALPIILVSVHKKRQRRRINRQIPESKN